MLTSPILDMYSITAQTMQINSLSIPVQIYIEWYNWWECVVQE